MADKPILFSGPMVRALLDGRKTQTRRVLKPSAKFPHDTLLRLDVIKHPGFVWWWDGVNERVGHSRRLPYAIGARLWVRETWARIPRSAYRHDPAIPRRADPGDSDMEAVYRAGWDRSPPSWKPAIHMPRWASRLTLEVTGVKVERVQEVSEGDAEAEGATATLAWQPYRAAFRDLWDSINGKRPGCSWADNPWVVAVTFAVHQRNIDAAAGHG